MTGYLPFTIIHEALVKALKQSMCERRHYENRIFEGAWARTGTD